MIPCPSELNKTAHAFKIGACIHAKAAGRAAADENARWKRREGPRRAFAKRKDKRSAQHDELRSGHLRLPSNQRCHWSSDARVD